MISEALKEQHGADSFVSSFAYICACQCSESWDYIENDECQVPALNSRI